MGGDAGADGRRLGGIGVPALLVEEDSDLEWVVESEATESLAADDREGAVSSCSGTLRGLIPLSAGLGVLMDCRGEKRLCHPGDCVFHPISLSHGERDIPTQTPREPGSLINGGCKKETRGRVCGYR